MPCRGKLSAQKNPPCAKIARGGLYNPEGFKECLLAQECLVFPDQFNALTDTVYTAAGVRGRVEDIIRQSFHICGSNM